MSVSAMLGDVQRFSKSLSTFSAFLGGFYAIFSDSQRCSQIFVILSDPL